MLVILSRKDGEGPHKLRATSVQNWSAETLVRSLTTLGMTN